MDDADYSAKDIDTVLGNFTNQEHKKVVMEYKKIRQQIDKVGLGTIQQDTRALLHLSTFLKNKKFIDATQEDMMQFEKWIMKQMGESSVELYEAKIKRFYKYLSNPDDYKMGHSFQKNISYPRCVAWIGGCRQNGKELPIDDILTEEEIKILLDACKDARDAVIIVSFVDGGLRASELRAMKIKNVGFDRELGANFILPKKSKGLKTGQRKVQLFLIPSATAYIKEYLNRHPFKNNPEAYFIYSESNCIRPTMTADTQISKNGLWKIVKRIVKNSKINKDIHPHTLRHISATWTAIKGFNEYMMRERFGWSKSSNMPSHYVHLAQKDSSDYIKKILGIKPEEKLEESKLAPILCPNCEYENVPSNVLCGRCGMKLNVIKEDLGMDATEMGINVQDMMKDPEFMMKMTALMTEEWSKLQRKKTSENKN